MTDIKAIRLKYDTRGDTCVCGEPRSDVGQVACWNCDRIPVFDPAVLALCDEVEALRAQVAAAPEVLREWPKTVEEAPGEWFFCIHGDCAPRGTFTTRDGSAMPVFEDESGGSLWVSGEMKPGEFFVRVP